MTDPEVPTAGLVSAMPRRSRSIAFASQARSMRLAAALACVVFAWASGCHERTPTAGPTPAKTYEVSGRIGSLRVSLDRERLTTADRLTLRIETTSEPGSPAVVRLDEPAFAGWTVVERSESEPTIDEAGRAVRVTRVVLEPFLAGEYTIPEIIAGTSPRTTGLPAGAAETIRTPKTTVIVTSSLAAGSDTRDVPPAPQYWRTEPLAGRGAAMLIGVVTTATAGVLIWWAFKRRTTDRSGVIDERALRVLTLKRAVERADYSGISPDLLSRVVADSMPTPAGGRDASDLLSVVQQLDEWRFGGVSASGDELRRAADAVARLVTNPSDARPAGVPS